MKNSMNPLERIKLMMFYDNKKTLNENLEEIKIINENEVSVDEAIGGAEAKEMTKLLRGGASEAEMIAKYAKNFGMSADAVKLALAKDLTTLNKDIAAAVKADAKSGVRVGTSNILGPAAKEASKAKAIKEIMGRGANITDKEIISIIERTKGESKTMARTIESKSGKVVTKDGTKAVATDTKAAGSGNVTVNVNQTVGGASGNLTKAAEDAVAAGDDKIKGILDDAKKLPDEKPTRWERWKAWGQRNPKSKKLLYLLGFGGIGYAAYKMLFSDTTPEQAKQLTFSNCAGSLVDDAGTQILATSGGDPVLKVTKTGNAEYDKMGGLKFYNNGRVHSVDNTKRGYWSCKGNTVIAESQLLNEGEIDAETFNEYIDDIGTYLARYVTEYNLKAVKEILLKIKGNTFEGKNAMSEFLRYYKMKQESDFVDDVNSVGVKTFIVTGTKLKQEIIQIATSTSGGTSGGDGKSTTGVDSIINIKWDGAKSGGGDGGNSGGGEGGKKTSKYYDCSSVNLDTTALTYGCKDNRIAEVQKCLGITADGKFGPATRKALTDNAYDMSKGITKEIYAKIIAGCKKGNTAAATTGSTVGGADVNYLRNPIKLDLGQVPEMPKGTGGKSASEGMTDAAYYQSLVDKGLIQRNAVGRIVYKGKVLEPADKAKLDNQMTRLGYEVSRIAATDEGARYVWKRA
jgi:hypothetical protein